MQLGSFFTGFCRVGLAVEIGSNQRRFGPGRTQAVGPDVVLAVIQGNRAGQHHDPALGRAVGREIRFGDDRIGGAEVDDRSTTPSFHEGNGRSAAEEHAGQIGAEHLVPERQVGIRRRRPGRDAGGGNQDVNPTEGLDGGPKEAHDLVGVGDVRRDRPHSRLGIWRRPGDGLVQGRQVPAREHDTGSFPRQCEGSCSANPGACSGNHRDSVFELHGRRVHKRRAVGTPQGPRSAADRCIVPSLSPLDTVDTVRLQ